MTRIIRVLMTAGVLVAAFAFGRLSAVPRQSDDAAVPGRAESPHPRPRRPDRRVITAVARIQGRTRIFAGAEHHLLAFRFDAGQGLQIGDATGSVWLLDGHLWDDVARPVEPNDFPPVSMGRGMLLAWVPLRPGDCLVAFAGVGPLFEPAERTELRLWRAGYRPLIVRTAAIPAIEAATAEELGHKLRALPDAAGDDD